jgi:putative protease
VAYSGQCLTSEALGGRSANRGQCAQACRMPYEMLVDARPRDLGDRAYLLSPQDLAAYDLLDQLVQLGVACFKIEGRLKSAEYVANTTQTYRAALTAALEGRPFVLSEQGRRDLEQSFSRGLTHGFLDGANHQVLVQGRFPKSRGVRVGTVAGMTDRGVLVNLAGADLVKPGDGVVFDEGHPEQDEQGGRVFEVRRLADGRRAELVFGRGAVNRAALSAGCIVWKTDDPALRRRLERSYAQDRPARRVPVTVAVRARVGQPLDVTVRDEDGHEAAVSWPGPLDRALKHPLTVDLLREQFGRLGETPFALAAVEADLPEPVLVPKSVLNELRRQAVARLLACREAAVRCRVAEPEALEHLRAEVAAAYPTPSRPTPLPQRGEGSKVAPSPPTPLPQGARGEENSSPPAPLPQGSEGRTARLYVLVRTLEQLDAVLAWAPPPALERPALVWCDFEDVRRYREAVARARAAGMAVGLAPLRVIKPGEEGLLRLVAGYGADQLLVRNLASLALFHEQAPGTPLVGDGALNVANELTAALLADQGLARLVPSYDLNWEQLVALLGRITPRLFEVVIHQHMPMFHMEHCVFAAFLSQGKDWRDCGRPCDRHRVELRDRVGAAFPVLADTGCRNTVFNALAQSAAEFVPRMRALGLRHFRVELLRETAAQVGPLLEGYARVLAGLDDGRGSWRRLHALNQLGVTRGTLQVV